MPFQRCLQSQSLRRSLQLQEAPLQRCLQSQSLRQSLQLQEAVPLQRCLKSQSLRRSPKQWSLQEVSTASSVDELLPRSLQFPPTLQERLVSRRPSCPPSRV